MEKYLSIILFYYCITFFPFEYPSFNNLDTSQHIKEEKKILSLDRPAIGNNCRRRDSLALVKVYQSTEGTNWNVSWNLNRPMSEWAGISLNENGCVREFALIDNNIKGKLPNELGQLHALEFLILSINQISGNLPDSMGNLENLKVLRLWSNQLSGKIPSSLSKLRKLEDLDLGNNNFEGEIPSTLSKLDSLFRLALNGNKLNGEIPPALFQLPNLEHLVLGHNKLSGQIPAEISALENILSLGFENNELEGSIPTSIQKLRACKSLNLSFNQLSGLLPESIGNMRALEELFLEHNNLEGPIPTSINQLNSLTALRLQVNNFSGVMPDVSNLNLRYLTMEQNNITELPDLSKIKTWDPGSIHGLRIGDNNLTFEDILPNMEIFNSFDLKQEVYAPQAKIFEPLTVTLDLNSNYTIDLNIDEAISTNIYTWYKNGKLYVQKTDNKLSFENIQAQDAGIYRVEVSNPNVPDLTLFSHNIKLTIECQTSATIIDTLVCNASNRPFLFDGQSLETSGTYEATFKSLTGCDSVVTLNLLVDEISKQEVENIPNQISCSSVFQLKGNLPDGAMGRWETNTQAFIQQIESSETDVQDLALGENEFTWYLSSENCPDYNSTKTIVYYTLDPPLAVDDYFFMPGDSIRISGNLLINDSIWQDAEILFDLEKEPDQGFIQLFENGTFTYTLDGFTEEVNFTYRLAYPACESIQDVADVVIEIERPDLEIPTGFTPNDDGINDVFYIPELANSSDLFPNNELLIYNRWGELVYEASPYKNDWQGTLKNTRNPLPDGTYYYVLRLDFGNKKIKSGPITIIR